jgi:hypothetical protein
MNTEEQYEELLTVHPLAKAAQEAGISYILLPGLLLGENCTPRNVDCLFCPGGRDGYPSRVFFSVQVNSPKQLNWHQTSRILERNWITFSWRVNQGGLRLMQILNAHLEALK